MIGRSAGEARSAALRASCAEICSGLKMKGASCCVSDVRGGGEMSKVLNEDSDYADGAEKGSYFREVFAQAPVDNFVDSRRIGDMGFQGANVPYSGNFSHAQ